MVERILAVLPQTQCTRCGYADCAAYAQAIAADTADINQCPPGGAQGIQRLSAITGRPVAALNPENGLEGPRSVAFIDENWCIGCTLCIAACPTDAIFGTNKMMHTVIEAFCTGCELCLPVCPVDCILLENVSGTATGWNAWPEESAVHARDRYIFHSYRANQDLGKRHKVQVKPLRQALDELPAPSQIQDPALLEKKHSVVRAAMALAKSKADLTGTAFPPSAP